jgi:hypothetical protein
LDQIWFQIYMRLFFVTKYHNKRKNVILSIRIKLLIYLLQSFKLLESFFLIISVISEKCFLDLLKSLDYSEISFNLLYKTWSWLICFANQLVFPRNAYNLKAVFAVANLYIQLLQTHTIKLLQNISEKVHCMSQQLI